MPQAAQQEQKQTFSSVTPISQTFTDVSPVDNAAPGNTPDATQSGVLSQSASVVGNQLKSAVNAPYAPFEDAYSAYQKARAGGKDVGAALRASLIGGAFSAFHPDLERAINIVDAHKQYVERREAGYNPVYAAAAPHVAPLVGVDLPATEEAAKKGNWQGVVANTAVPAAEVVASAGLAKAAPEVTPAIRSGWRTIGNPFGLASTGQELLTQGISPRTSMLNFKPSLERAAGDLKAYDAQSPINNVQDLHDAIPEIKQKIWGEEVEPALKRQADKPVNMQPVADAVRGQISDEMKTFDEANADKLEKLATKLEATRDVKSANSLLKYVNGQLESYFQKFPAARKANLMNNPETAGWEAARAELRNQFLTTLEANGETGVRDARLRYGAFDTLQDAVERRVNVADRAKPMSLGRIVGIAGAAPTGGLSLVAGEISNYLNKPDVLVRRGISALPRQTPFAPPSAANPLASSTANIFDESLATARQPRPNLPGGPAQFEQSRLPQYIYRVHDEGIPTVDLNAHAHATGSAAEAQSYVGSRNEGTPQVVSRIKTSNFKPGDITVMQGPNGQKWYKFNRQLTSADYERVDENSTSNRRTGTQ